MKNIMAAFCLVSISFPLFSFAASEPSLATALTGGQLTVKRSKSIKENSRIKMISWITTEDIRNGIAPSNARGDIGCSLFSSKGELFNKDIYVLRGSKYVISNALLRNKMDGSGVSVDMFVSPDVGFKIVCSTSNGFLNPTEDDIQTALSKDLQLTFGQ